MTNLALDSSYIQFQVHDNVRKVSFSKNLKLRKKITIMSFRSSTLKAQQHFYGRFCKTTLIQMNTKSIFMLHASTGKRHGEHCLVQADPISRE